MPVHNAEIAAMFDQAAELLEIKGDNPFRTRAYQRAARVIESLPKSAESMLQAGEDLSELPGIGEDLAGKIGAIVATGKFDLRESLKRELPGDLSELTAIPGLGPKRVKLLIEKLGVRSVEDLRCAAKSGRLRALRGFGPKLEQNIVATLAKPVEVHLGSAILENSARCSGDGDVFLSTPNELSRQGGPIGCALHTATRDLGRGR